MKSRIPKQFLLLDGRPVLMNTILAFYEFDKSLDIIVALPGDLFDAWKKLCKKHGFAVPHRLARGGRKRFHSVKNSLKLVRHKGLVAIHDGARPLVTRATISKAFREAAKYGSAIPVVPMNESVRWVTTGLNEPFDRDQLRIVQTPQVFGASEILKAYLIAKDEDHTDDASVFESAGNRVHLFEGDPQNIKITYPSDLILAGALKKRKL